MQATQSRTLAGLEMYRELVLRDKGTWCSRCGGNVWVFFLGVNHCERYSHSGHRGSVTNPTLSYDKLYRDKYRDLLQHWGFYPHNFSLILVVCIYRTSRAEHCHGNRTGHALITFYLKPRCLIFRVMISSTKQTSRFCKFSETLAHTHTHF